MFFPDILLLDNKVSSPRGVLELGAGKIVLGINYGTLPIKSMCIHVSQSMASLWEILIIISRDLWMSFCTERRVPVVLSQFFDISGRIQRDNYQTSVR